MKKIIFAFLIIVGILTITGCGSSNSKQITIDGVYLDELQEIDEESDLIYIFYTFTAEDENINLHDCRGLCTGADIQIDKNEYGDLIEVPANTSLIKAYQGTGYNTSGCGKTIYSGSSMKLVSAFRVGKSDLEKGKKIKFVLNTLNDSNGFSTTIKTDDIITLKNANEINNYVLNK